MPEKTAAPVKIRFALGARVQFQHALVRRNVSEPHPSRVGSHDVTRWMHPLFAKPDAPMRDGILVGYRTKYDGYTRWLGSDEGNVFVPVSHRTVALVVTTLRTNPVCVEPSDLVLVLDPRPIA